MLGPEIKTGLSGIKPFLFIIISKLCVTAHVYAATSEAK